MRLLVIAFMLAVSLAMEGAASAQDGAKLLDDAWVKGAKAGDVEALVALYAPDAVLYPPDMMEARGTAAIRKALTGMLAAVTVTDMRIDATYATTGDTSVGWGHFYMTVTPKGGGAPQKMEGRATVVAKRIGGKWLYVTDHASVPLPPPPAAPSR